MRYNSYNIYFKISEYSYLYQVPIETGISKILYQIVYKRSMHVKIIYLIIDILLVSQGTYRNYINIISLTQKIDIKDKRMQN